MQSKLLTATVVLHRQCQHLDNDDDAISSTHDETTPDANLLLC